MSLPAKLRQQLIDLFDQAVEQHSGQNSKERAQLRKRLTELERQEDRYIELVIDPDWPRAKITAKLRDIRDERARLQAKLKDDGQQVQRGRDNARRVLDYLEAPHQLYEQAGAAAKAKLNRLLFSKLRIDVRDGNDPQVAGDELNEPFATVVYLRRDGDTVPLTPGGPVGTEPRFI